MIDYGSYRNEYLITNTFGSYSSSNYLYGNTRKYHGLLVATEDQLTKFNILNRILDSYKNTSEELFLTSNIYQNEIIEPQGYKYQKSFNFKPFPKWSFQSNTTKITKTILLDHYENSLLIKYEFNTVEAGVFTLKPLINFRSIHSTENMSDNVAPESLDIGNYIKINLANEHILNIWYPGSIYRQQTEIYYRFYYPDEAKRGYQFLEDLIQPCFFESTIPAGISTLFFKFSYNNYFSENLESVWQKEITRKKTSLTTNEPTDQSTQSQEKKYNLPLELDRFQKNLEDQAELFINSVNNHSGICAGYHWFDEWSRDTFVSLFGLTISTNNSNTAQNILENWGKQLKQGLLPNRLLFTSILNSLDSVFWFTIRLYQFSLIKNDFTLCEKFLPNLENILIQFHNKTHNIEITPEGFLYDNNATEALTWIDAKVGEKPVIDRSGMAVEIQALWYNYIRIMIIVKENLNDRTHLTYLKELKITIERNFEKVFWNSSQNCLVDCVREDFTDRSVRPNQVIVAYLPFKLLGNRKNKMILATAEQKLLTDLGLKTLTKEDTAYIGEYTGDQKQRDLSYHQGTVWPFLLGFYLCAYYETYLKTKSAKNYVIDKLMTFQNALDSRELNYIPEIFSAEELEPNGCIAQAWSVAMTLETIYHLRSN